MSKQRKNQTARALVLSLVVANAPQPTPLKVIREYLVSKGKKSNSTVETQRLVSSGELIRTENGFVPGSGVPVDVPMPVLVTAKSSYTEDELIAFRQFVKQIGSIERVEQLTHLTKAMAA